jgi:methylmalonyl-CoA epimerase
MKIKRIEHIAIAVKSMAQSREIFEAKLGLSLEYEEYLPQYNTRLAMYPVGQTYIELLESDGDNTETARWIAEHGEGLFHICFEVEDVEEALDELKRKGVKLIDEQPRIGHANAYCLHRSEINRQRADRARGAGKSILTGTERFETRKSIYSFHWCRIPSRKAA